MMGASDLGTFDGQGNIYSTVKTPWALCFKPTDKLRAEYEGFPPFKHPSELLQFVEPGEHLYEMFAITEAEALMYTKREDFLQYVVKVADIHLESNFNRCEWCDSVMWVRHTRMEEDLAHAPRWTPVATNLKYLIRTGSVGLYQYIMPSVTEDQVNYQLSLTKYSDQVLRFFSTKRNFNELLRQFGITPQQLLDEHIERTVQTFKVTAENILRPSLDDDKYPSVGPSIKISPRWLYRVSQNFGEPVLQYWKKLGINTLKVMEYENNGASIGLETVIEFANAVISNLNHFYDDGNLALRYRTLKHFLRTTSPLYARVTDNLCEVFDNRLFFINCEDAKSWMLNQACHLYVLATSLNGREGFIASEVINWRMAYCQQDPPMFVELTEGVDVGSTVFEDTPVLKWPQIDDEYIDRLGEELSRVKDTEDYVIRMNVEDE